MFWAAMPVAVTVNVVAVKVGQANVNYRGLVGSGATVPATQAPT